MQEMTVAGRRQVTAAEETTVRFWIYGRYSQQDFLTDWMLWGEW